MTGTEEEEKLKEYQFWLNQICVSTANGQAGISIHDMSLMFGYICCAEQLLLLLLICKTYSKMKQVEKFRNETSVWHHTHNY